MNIFFYIFKKLVEERNYGDFLVIKLYFLTFRCLFDVSLHFVAVIFSKNVPHILINEHVVLAFGEIWVQTYIIMTELLIEGDIWLIILLDDVLIDDGYFSTSKKLF